ncbi:MAG: hypothetical protein JJT82_05895 [Legionellaceae bacterium]|nr:hypothetical protein [Legionellaceae bacterium]
MINNVCGESSLRTIKIAVVQPFSEQASTASSRYRANFESAISYALGKNEVKLNSCGAKFRIDFFYYPADSLLEANKTGLRIENDKYWFVIAPARAKHCLALANSISKTPIFTLNATGDGCIRSSQIRFSTSLPNPSLVKGLVTYIVKNTHIKSYGAVDDPTCPECNEFVSEFELFAKEKSIKKKFNVSAINVESASTLNNLYASLDKNKVNALLVPNYSKYSGFIMAKVHEKYPEIIFLGNDGWGQGDWSYIPFFNLPNSVEAYSVRSYLPMYKPGSINSLDKVYKEKILTPSNLSSSTVSLIDTISDFVCNNKINSRNDFFKKLSRQPSSFARKGADIAIYKLASSRLILDEVYAHE